MKKINKGMVHFVAFILTCSLFAGFTNLALEAKAETPAVEAKTVSASQKYADAMEPGWNLGNSFDSFDSTQTIDKGELSWGNPIVTKDLIKTVRAQGFNSIRIPFTAIMRTGSAPDYTIDAKYLARYTEVIQWALDENLYVDIDLHCDCAGWAKDIDSDNGEAMKRYIAVMTQLVNHFKDYSDKLCFESLNEPQFDKAGDIAKQIKILEKVNTEFHKLIRNSGGNNSTRMIILPTLVTNDSQDRCESLYNTIKSLNDPNIMATFHFYGFYPFGVNCAGYTTFNGEVNGGLRDAFMRMNNNFTSKGIGVICGEYGLLGQYGIQSGQTAPVEHGEMLKYYEYVNHFAKETNITMMLWDPGTFIGRTSYKWSDPSMYNIMKASWTSRSSYTESDRIFIKDKDRKQDVPMKLTLNGNTLKSIYNGTTELVAGKDYIYNNDTVTLNGSYIDSVIKSDCGVNATLTMKFSAGADWNVDIYHQETPVLGTGQSVGKTFEIPVQFNGSMLSTLEAVKPDGTLANSNNWTTYEQYNGTFSIDYNANKVIINENFFKGAKPGKITFKLHFQSGEVLQYSINNK